ncbi:MAG: protein-glutamate O-methyltransferase CheR [Acidobacteria bacterium]|nr:protein-glutamate O-methyltransferase CheR [Acidobacteriota bacterium]
MRAIPHPDLLESVLSTVTMRTGLVFPGSRRSRVEEQLLDAARSAGARSIEEYGARLREEEALLAHLVDELTVGETYFFRQPGQFDFIRREILPQYCRTHDESAVFRAWSAGCASGEEPYSLAIVAAQEGFGERSRILATDISRAALESARRATFRRWSFRGVDDATKAKYFRPTDDQFRLIDRIRRAVDFEHLNLALDGYPSSANGTWKTDLILCRNVLIYFDRETIREVAQRLYAALTPGGWLLTAGSDPPLQNFAPFDVVLTGDGYVYRRSVSAERTGAALSRKALIPIADPEPVVRNELKVSPVMGVSRAPEKRPVRPTLHDAMEAFSRGDYGRCAAITADHPDDAAAASLHLRAVANGGSPERAETAAAGALERHPLNPEIQFLRAMILLELGRDQEAEGAVRRAIFLDSSLALPQFILGSILQRRGDSAGAARAYRNTRELLAEVDSDQIVALSDGETAEALRNAAAQRLDFLSLHERRSGA